MHGISMKRWSWLALFGFAWMQFGLIAHLSLVGHDIDGQGRIVHSFQHDDSSSQRHDNYADASRSSSKRRPQSPLTSEDCQVLHFIEHSSGLISAASSQLSAQLLQALADRI